MFFGKVIFFIIIHMSNGAEYINRDLVLLSGYRFYHGKNGAVLKN